MQYAAATAFADRYQEGSLLLTGHSKGGNVALYAQSAAQNPLARAAVFNAQGFACHALSKTQKQRLRAGAVNYVVAGDIVGALLCHPETRFYVRQNPGTNAHSPDAFAFGAEGLDVYKRQLSMCVLPFILPDCAKIALALFVSARLRPLLTRK